MKRIALILMFASISIVMFANKSAPTHTEKGVKARGQPTIELNYNVYAVPEFVGSAEAGSILSPVIVTRNPVEYVKGIVTGTRKIRDVDSCNGNLYTYSNDKRNAIKIKTPRLARGFGSLRILFIYLA